MYAREPNTRELVCACEHTSPNTQTHCTHSVFSQGCNPIPENSKVSNKTQALLHRSPNMETNKMATVSPARAGLAVLTSSHLNGVRGRLTGVQRRRVSGGSWLGKRDQRMAAPWIRAPQWSIVNWAPCVKATERLVCTAAAICHNCP